MLAGGKAPWQLPDRYSETDLLRCLRIAERFGLDPAEVLTMPVRKRIQLDAYERLRHAEETRRAQQLVDALAAHIDGLVRVTAAAGGVVLK